MEMSSIGVVVIRGAGGKPPVLQEAIDNSANISNNEQSAPRPRLLVVRKKRRADPPATVAVAALVRAAGADPPATGPAAPPARRPRAPPDDVRAPTPLAVARRNARERNRVRQVNDGFAALRRHIPDEVAEAFESVTASRGPNKKLSKVETLRMAVEYIRNLEALLNIGRAADKENAREARPSAEAFPSPTSSSSPHDGSADRMYFSFDSPPFDDDDMADDDELDAAGHHADRFGRPPRADSFRLSSTPHLYEEDEGARPSTPASDLVDREGLTAAPHPLGDGFALTTAAERFTVIHPEAYCAAESSSADYEVKYAHSLASQIHYGFEEHPELSLDTIDADIVLSQGPFRFKEISNATLDDDTYDDVDLKKELPDIQVTAEDREQFEETLKWWQEKTRCARPVLLKTDTH